MKKSKISLILFLNVMLSISFISKSNAISKIDETSIMDRTIRWQIAEHDDILPDRILGYPAENFTKDNIIYNSNNELTIENPSRLLSIGNGGTVRIVELEQNEKTKKFLTVDYGNIVINFKDMKDLELKVKDGEKVDIGVVLGKCSSCKMEILKENKKINPYVLLFKNLYPRGGMKIPLFSQLDSRWKNNPYGDSNIYIAGCGPSCLSMIYSYFNNDIISPAEVVSSIGGSASPYMISGQGSSWNLLSEEPMKNKIKSRRISGDQVLDALRNNHPVIALMGRGYFTDAGHYIVLRGIDKNGNVLVNNPADFKEDYKKSFSINMIKSQAKQFWEYYRDFN